MADRYRREVSIGSAKVKMWRGAILEVSMQLTEQVISESHQPPRTWSEAEKGPESKNDTKTMDVTFALSCLYEFKWVRSLE